MWGRVGGNRKVLASGLRCLPRGCFVGPISLFSSELADDWVGAFELMTRRVYVVPNELNIPTSLSIDQVFRNIYFVLYKNCC